MMRLAVAALLLVPAAGGALAAPCPPGEGPRGKRTGRPACEGAEKLRPYDPDAARAGRSPGFIDLGHGTEVRIGGRVRMDYDARRR